MKKLWIAFALLQGLAWAGPSEDYAQLQREHSTRMRPLAERARTLTVDAPDWEQHKRAMQTELDLHYSNLLAFAQKNPNTKQALHALQQAINIAPPAQRQSTLTLLKAYQDNPLLAGSLLAADAALEPFLLEVAEASRSAEVRTAARIALGRIYMRAGKVAESGNRLQQVLRENPKILIDGTRADEIAQPMLYELEHLQVGMKFPELSGEDLEGRPLSLADHRGKVVLLAFWASW